MMGSASATPTNPDSLTASEAPSVLKSAVSLRGMCGQRAPAISKGREVLNVNEFIVERPELVADPFDRRADVGAVALLAATGDEARVVHAVVDGAVCRVFAG